MSRSLAGFPPVETERLRLRPLGPADADAFRVLTDEPSILDAVHFLPRPFTLVDAELLVTGDVDGRNCFWGVWLQGGSTLIGTLGTHLRGVEGLEVGYWFASTARGRGLAAEAVTSLVFTLSTAYPERRLFAECRPQNEGSWRLLETVGFQADGAEGARPGRKRLVFCRP